MQSISPLTADDLRAKVQRMAYKFEVYDGAAWVDIATQRPKFGLAGYWPFNEIAGLTARDKSGYGADGTLTNMAAEDHVSGQMLFGNALDFDGTDDYVTIPDASQLDITAAITLSAWVKPSSNPAWAVVISKGTSTSWNSNNYVLGLQGGRVDFRWNGKGTVLVDAGDALTVGVWQHILAVAEAGTTDALKVYINGVLKKQGNRSGDPTTNSQALRIGSDNGTDNFAGQIDEVRIYNRAVAAEEIAALASVIPFSLLKSVTVDPSGAGPTPSVVAGTWSAEIKNPDGIFHPFHPTSEYADLFRIGRQARISIGGVYSGTTYYWQRLIGYMDAPRFDHKTKTVMLSGCDYSKRLADLTLGDSMRFWGDSVPISTAASAEVLGSEQYNISDAVQIASEIDDMSYWTAEDPTRLTSETDSWGGSTYVARLTKQISVYGNSAYVDGVGSVTLGHNYKLTFKYKIISGAGSPEFRMRVYASGGASNLMAAFNGYSWDSGGETATVYFQATASGSLRLLVDAFDITTAACGVEWDVVSIKEVTGYTNTTYELPAGCKGPYFITLDGEPINFNDTAEKNGWLYNETTRVISFVDGAMIPGGTGNLIVYYYETQTLENVVADILVYAGIYADQAAALAAMDYVATGVDLDRVWFDSGTPALEAIRMLCERVNYRFWFAYDGTPTFRPAPELTGSVFAFNDGTLAGWGDEQDLGQLRNRVVIEGIEQGMFVIREDKKRIYLTGESSDATSIATYLEHTESIKNHLFQDQASITAMAAAVLAARKDPKWYSRFNLSFLPVPLEIGDTVGWSCAIASGVTVNMGGFITAISLTDKRATYTVEIDETYGDWFIVAEAGAYAVVGAAAGTLKGSKVSAEAGAYALTGQAATLGKLTTLTYDTDDSFSVPAGVTSIQVEAWGQGGWGGGRSGSTGGGGAGGGAYSKSTAIAVTPSETLDILVGDGGNSTPDKDTELKRGAAVLVRAASGDNAVDDAEGGGGLASDGVGDTKYSGGDGAPAAGSTGGGGGSSAGTSQNGNNASGQAGGSAPTGGADGGDGGGVDQNGENGAAPGGGAGGSGGASGGAPGPGYGAPGRLIIRYVA